MDLKLFPLVPGHNRYKNTYGTVPLKGKAPKYHVKPVYKPFLALADIAGNILFFATKLARQPQNPKKILMIRLDHLGDVVMTLPAYAAVRRLYPKAEIHTLVRSFVQELFYKNRDVDKVIPFDPPWFARDKKAGLLKTLKFLLKLRKEKYDLVIEFHADPRNILAATVIGGYRIGYGLRGFGFLLNKVVPYPVFDHLVETNTNIIRALGFREKTPLQALKLHYANADRHHAEMLVGKKTRRIVLINPGTGRPNKYWLAERWAKVGDALADHGCSVFLTGSSADIPECEKIASQMVHKPVVLAGKTTIRQFLALVSKSSLVLCPDTSLDHFSACLKTPAVVLFGPIPPSICSYESPRRRVIVKCLPCSYCARAVCPRKDSPNECMNLITEDEVIAAAKNILG
ncbi:MAG: glycosyltransferase family 9 protein [Candidatus Woesearchaeota archaeon]